MDDWTSFGAAPAQNNKTNNYGNNNPSTAQNHNQQPNFSPQHFFNTVALNQPKPNEDQPTFELEQQPDTIDASSGQAVCMATAANWIIIGTSFNNLIRWHMGDTDDKDILTLSTKPNERIFEVFISPNGRHILISMTNGALYYIPTDSNVTKPTQIQKFKDIVQSVAWYQYDSDLSSSAAATTAVAAGGNTSNITNPTQRALLGTTVGALWELVIEEQRERSLKKLYELNSNNNGAIPSSSTPIQRNRRPSVPDDMDLDPNGLDFDETPAVSQPTSGMGPATAATGSFSIATAITGIRIIRAGVDDRIRTSGAISPTSALATSQQKPRYHLFFVTSSHEYKLSGGPTVEAMFSHPAVTSGNLSFIELPGGLLTSNQLATFTPSPTQPISEQAYGEHLTQALVSPESYGWLTAAGVYYAHINPNCPQLTTINATQTSDQFSVSERLIECPKIVDQDAIQHRITMGDGIGHKQHYLQPISILLTQFHIIFLFRQHLAIINLVNGTVVMSVSLPKATFGATRKLTMDETTNTYWLLTDKFLYEIIVSHEGRDIWRLYLSQGDYDNAYQHCTTSHQSKIVSTAHADALFQQGDYFQAAQQYIRSVRTFESVCMKYLLEYQQYSTNNHQIDNNQGDNDSGDNSNHGINGNNQNKSDQERKSSLSAISSNITNGMPSSLFTSTISSLFGPNQLANHKLLSAGQSTQDVDPATGAGAGAGAGGATPSSSLALVSSQDPTAASSLSLLLSTMSLPNCKDSGNNTNSTTTSSSSSSSASSNAQNNSSSYAYIYTIFSLLEKKWAIYSGLKTYLKLMLTNISQSDKTKLTTLASWVIEISVNTLVSLQTSFLSTTASSSSSSTSSSSLLLEQQRNQVSPEIVSLEEQRIQLYNQECKDLEELIQDYLDVLHPTTTYQLLSIAGRTKEALFYAKLNKHYGYVFDMYLREKLFIDAIDYLRTLRRRITATATSGSGGITQTQLEMMKYLNPSSSTTPQPQPMTYSFTIEPDIIYRIIPTLLQQHPSPLVDLLIETDGLQSTQVLTAMVRSGLHIEFTVNPDTIDPSPVDRESAIVDPSLRQLQNTMSQFGVTIPGAGGESALNAKDSKKQPATITDQSIANGLQNPSNIKSLTAKQGATTDAKNYLYHVSRYLVALISSSLAPSAAHNLYVAILIQLRDATRLYNYLISQKHATSPNRAFALRLALPHVEELYASVIELCLQLQRYTLAIRFAMRYDNHTAKIILKTMTTSTSSVIPMSITGGAAGTNSIVPSEASPHSSANVEQSLWQEYVQLLFSQGLSISQIIQDIRGWFSGEEQIGAGGANATPLIASSAATTANNTTLLKILPSLPTTITISDIQSNVITQLVDFNNQLNQLNMDMSALHLTNNNLKYQLHSLQQQIIAVSTSQRCDICSQPAMLSPFIYFRCGHVFHLLCCVNTVVGHLNAFAPAATYAPPTQSGSSNFNQQLALSLAPHGNAQARSLTKKQNIFLRLLNDLHDDLTTTASLSQTSLQDVDQNFCSDEVMDLVSIQGLKHKVLTGTLTQEEELFFIEEYAQQSCVCCGDLIIESIGLNVGGVGIEDDDWTL